MLSRGSYIYSADDGTGVQCYDFAMPPTDRADHVVRGFLVSCLDRSAGPFAFNAGLRTEPEDAVGASRRSAPPVGVHYTVVDARCAQLHLYPCGKNLSL